MPVSAQERDRALAERHKPLLVLYPEISSEQRAHRDGWREANQAPLLADYHPRDLALSFDHARVRSGPGRTDPMHDRQRLIDAMAANRSDRIDILDGAGHADRDKFWSSYYQIVGTKPPHERDEAYPYAAYANVVYSRDLGSAGAHEPLVAIEYWLFYLYNDWKSTHEGDWELAVVFLRQSEDPQAPPQPIACACSAHFGGYRLAWDHVGKADDAGHPSDAGAHPVVYVANGSHANYFFGPGSYHTSTKVFGARVTSGEFPFTGSFVDFTTSIEEGRAVFPGVKLVPPAENGLWTGDWRWLNFTGEWGSLGVPRWLGLLLSVVPKRYRFDLKRKIWSAPASLPPRRNWADPFSWADQECEEAPVPSSWLANQ